MVPLAAYDPIFRAHHTMIDRLWALWQLRHPGAGPDPSMLNTALPPFSMTVAETLDITSLGYQYAASVSESTSPGPERAMATFTSHPITVSLDRPPGPFVRADLAFHGVNHARASFEARLFLNYPEAGPDTPTDDHHGYAGSFFVFGHGGCAGDEGHCDVPSGPRRPFDLRPEQG